MKASSFKIDTLETNLNKAPPKLWFIFTGLAIAAGAVFIYRQELGRTKRTEKPNHQTDFPILAEAKQVDEVDRQSQDSFPASDPPSWSGSVAGGAH